MNLIQILRDTQLDCRRSAQLGPVYKARALTLGTVIAEATRQSKEPTDDETLKALRKVRAGVLEMQVHVTTDVRASEIEFLSKFIPETLSLDETADAVEATGLVVVMRNMKEIKEAIEVRYPGRVDGALLAKVVKEWGTN